jgi:predicted DNA-binding transcriptional regulator YafY
MRADRLLSMLILLQTRGRMTARNLADELEVSERTVYRDVEALGTAGVPVYAERGPGGGISLLEEYRTNLTGLTADEARALFMLSIPSPLLQLGVGRELRAAMLKLSAALPAAHKPEQQAAQQRIFLDASWWGQSGQPGPYLGTVQQGVWDERRMHIVTRTVFGIKIEQEVEPLGLVAKANVWYLVAQRAGRPMVYRVADLAGAELLPERFSRPENFDLADFWQDYSAQVEAQRSLYWVTARIAPGLAAQLHSLLGDQASGVLAQASLPDEQGWVTVRMSFEWEGQAREKLLGMGSAAQIIEPIALRKNVIDFAQQVLHNYKEFSENHGTSTQG